MRDEGARGAALALKQVDQIDEYLSACQLGITMASLGIGFLGEPAIASLLEDVLGDSVPHGVSLAISIGDRLPDHHRPAHHRSASRCRRSTRSCTRRARRCAWRARCTGSGSASAR